MSFEVTELSAVVGALSVWGGKRSSNRGGKGLSRARVRDGVWGG